MIGTAGARTPRIGALALYVHIPLTDCVTVCGIFHDLIDEDIATAVEAPLPLPPAWDATVWGIPPERAAELRGLCPWCCRTWLALSEPS